MRVLVVAAHPDDEVLGAGGTIARHVRQGDEVHVAVLGEGGTARFAERTGARAAHIVDDLAASFQAAATVLGVAGAQSFGLPDNRFDSLDLLDVVKVVEGVVARVNPDVVYTHHAYDLNIDHRVTAAAVVTATRPLPGTSVDSVLAFEIASASEWNFAQLDGRFVATHFVELADEDFAVKVAALDCYGAEMRPFPHRRSYEVIDAMSRLTGSTVGLQRAEGFCVLRSRDRLAS
jgi:LmbE family N-acetylglucosaminyl deacetylase